MKTEQCDEEREEIRTPSDWLWREDDHRTDDDFARFVPQDEMVAEAMPTYAPGRARWLWREDSNLRPAD